MRKIGDIKLPTEQERKIISSKNIGECENCQQTVYETKMQRPTGEVVTVRLGCNCEQIKAFKEKQKEKMLNAYKNNSILPIDYENKLLREYIPKTESQKKAKELAINFIRNIENVIDNGLNFTILGSTGTGKTHIALSIYNQLVKEQRNVLFLVITDYYNLLKESYENKNKADTTTNKKIDIISDYAKKADVLILDDVGANKMTEWANEKLFDLINSRIGKSTIITSNFSEEHLMSDVELNRWLSRLRENGIVHTIIGNDERVKKQIENFGEK